jgi:hypothetical protein
VRFEFNLDGTLDELRQRAVQFTKKHALSEEGDCDQACLVERLVSGALNAAKG